MIQKLTIKDFQAQMAIEKQMKTDMEIDAMSSGEFYHYMLDKNGFEWAKQANRMARLGLDAAAEHTLGTWFANAQMAMTDRQHADYIKLRLDAEQAEDQPA